MSTLNFGDQSVVEKINNINNNKNNIILSKNSGVNRKLPPIELHSKTRSKIGQFTILFFNNFFTS